LVQRSPDPPSVGASLRIHQPVPINASISRSNTSIRMTADTADLIRIAIRSGLVDRDAGLWAALCDAPRS
jgi:hypothetical protein